MVSIFIFSLCTIFILTSAFILGETGAQQEIIYINNAVFKFLPLFSDILSDAQFSCVVKLSWSVPVVEGPLHRFFCSPPFAKGTSQVGTTRPNFGRCQDLLCLAPLLFLTHFRWVCYLLFPAVQAFIPLFEQLLERGVNHFFYESTFLASF